MKILPAPAEQRPGCVLHSDLFGVSVRIHGIGVPQARYLFGAGGQAFDWTELAAAGPVEVALDSESAPAGEDCVTELADGTVTTVSGAAARIRVGAGHRIGEDRFPDSLALALAQQWARAGLCVLHAAGIRIAGRGHVFVGGKGQGKSTLTAAALAAGGQAVSDDWLLIGTDDGATPCMERLRGFLMLRRGWAASRLGDPSGSGFQPHPHRHRLLLSSRSDPQRLPASSAIHGLWLLERRAGWPSASSVHPVLPATVMSRLMAGSMPLLYSSRFPVEHGQLVNLMARLTDRLPLGRLRPGVDVVEARDGTTPSVFSLLEERVAVGAPAGRVGSG